MLLNKILIKLIRTQRHYAERMMGSIRIRWNVCQLLLVLAVFSQANGISYEIRVVPESGLSWVGTERQSVMLCLRFIFHTVLRDEWTVRQSGPMLNLAY